MEKNSRPKVIITVEGGVIQDIHADTEEVDVLVVDFDEDQEEWHVPRMTIPDTDGETFHAHVFKMPITVDQEWVRNLNKLFDERTADGL